MQYLIQLLVSGLAIGAIYGLIAMGFAVIYKSTGLVNFAQGDLQLRRARGQAQAKLPFATTLPDGTGSRAGRVLPSNAADQVSGRRCSLTRLVDNAFAEFWIHQRPGGA